MVDVVLLVTRRLRRMESRGLIARTTCADDARATMVALTDAGRRAVERAAPGHVETVRAHLFGHLDAAHVDALAGICTRLLEQDAVPRQSGVDALSRRQVDWLRAPPHTELLLGGQGRTAAGGAIKIGQVRLEASEGS